MKLSAKAEIPLKMKAWWQDDWRNTRKWRQEAREDYDFVAGHQWTDDEKATLEEQMRPVITFNRMGVTVDAVSGSEIGNRQEVRFIPREEGDAKPNELLTSAGQWFDDVSGAGDEESEAFRDNLTSGMGWVETWVDRDEGPEGDPSTERRDPFEMVWDFASKRKNLKDARRVWHVRKYPVDEAKEMFPGFDVSQLDFQDAGDLDQDETTPHVSDGLTKLGGGEVDTETDTKEVTIARVQWCEREVYWKAVSPMTGELVEMTNEEHQTAKKRGFEFRSVRFKRKVRRQAFLGRVVLEAGDVATREHFNFKCITGKRDRNRGHWYGLVRSMKDPQRWHNKWLSQMLHIVNSNAKGGLLAEKDAFEDQRAAEDSWAKNDRITFATPGAIANGKIQPKPQTALPTAFQYLTEFAASSIPDVSGVNVEMLGLREANQPGVLEYQRRQSGMTILQPLFDSLKAYRTDRGKLVLYYLQNELADGRLIRVVGKQQEKYVPLMKQAELEYDIIVDDSPSAPNQKEMIWSVIGPQFMSLPPHMMAVFVDTMPLPESKILEVKEALQQMIQGQSQAAQMQKQIEMQAAQADIGKTQSETMENKAQTAKIASEIGQQPPGSDQTAEVIKLRTNAALTARGQDMTNQTQRRKIATDAFLAQRKQDDTVDLELMRMRQNGG